MHVAMISLDSTIFTDQIGDTRARHQAYAARANARLSLVVCQRGPAYPTLRAGQLTAVATGSSTVARYLRDAVAVALQLHQQEKFDVIASQDPFLTGLIGLRLRRACKAPLIVQDHSCYFSSPHYLQEHPRNRLLRFLGRMVVRNADAVRVVNHAEKAACVRFGVPATRICVSPVPVPLAGFAAPPNPIETNGWRERLGLTPVQPLILWVGRPVTFKNLPMLLDAFAIVSAQQPEARLVIAGSMAGTQYKEQAALMGLAGKVIFAGPVAYPDLPALYQTATLYALSSNYEGLGRVLLEAAAAALPIVSTEQTSSVDALRHEQTGLLVPIGDSEAMAAAILRLLQDPPLAARLGQAAKQDILHRFAEDKLADSWVGMWQRTANKEQPCAS
jgi:glycosyltransferase involved in cell wall biosynthesis